MPLVSTFDLPLIIVSFMGVARAQISDTTPPQLTAFSVSDASVDVTAGEHIVSWSATLTDDLSGPSWVYFCIFSPTNVQVHQAIVTSTADPVPLPRDFVGTLTVPQYVESGIWEI